MKLKDKNGFVLPELHLSSLPTGAVKKLVDTLGKRITNGEYKIGNKIPMEPALVEEHGVSRTVVREAIKVLSGKGMVRTARRYGTQVCSIEEWNLLDPDVISWHKPDSPMARKIFIDATRFRLMIEPPCAAMAAEMANDLQRETIMTAAAQMNDSSVDSHAIAADFAFHATILEASGNLMLGQFRGFLHAILQFTYSTKPIVLKDTELARQLHMAVAQSINDGDEQLAAENMHTMLSINADFASELAVGEAPLAARM